MSQLLENGSVPKPPDAERDSSTSARRVKTPLVLLLAGEAWLLLGAVSMWWWTVEDAYIGYRYAVNLSRGLGLVLNQGARVEGYTNFLWVLLLSGSSRLALDPIISSKVLGILFNALALVACFCLCKLVSNERMKGIALVLTGASALFFATSVEGLETPLFTMLLCWELVTYLKALGAQANKQVKWLAWSSILSALLLMTRPDGALTFGLLCIHAAWRFRTRPKGLVAFTLPAVLLYAPYFLWRWHYYGLFFPNTFYAKSGGTLALATAGIFHVTGFLSSQTGGLGAAGAVAMFALLFPSTETTVLGCAVISRLAFEVWSGGMTAGNSRFLVPALPLIWILTERLFTRGLHDARLGRRGSLALAGVAALLVAIETLQFTTFRETRRQEERGLQQAHMSLGHWLRQNSSPDKTVAVGDIGGIGYWSGLRILDLDGLGDTYISHQRGAFGTKGDASYILAQHPDWVVLRMHACEPQEDASSPGIDRKIYRGADFQSEFERLGCWDFSSDYHLLLFRRRSPAKSAASQ